MDLGDGGGAHEGCEEGGADFGGERWRGGFVDDVGDGNFVMWGHFSFECAGVLFFFNLIFWFDVK